MPLKALRKARSSELNEDTAKPLRSTMYTPLPTYLPAASEQAGKRYCIVHSP